MDEVPQVTDHQQVQVGTWAARVGQGKWCRLVTPGLTLASGGEGLTWVPAMEEGDATTIPWHHWVPAGAEHPPPLILTAEQSFTQRIKPVAEEFST